MIDWICLFGFIACLVRASVMDVRTMHISLVHVLVAIVFTALQVVFNGFPNQSFFSLGFISVVFFLTAVYFRIRHKNFLAVFGIADIIIFYIIAFWLDFQSYLLFFNLSIISAILYSWMKKQEKLPFVPFLTFGFVCILVALKVQKYFY